MTLDAQDALKTGIDTLDRKLGGGIPFGTVTALSASPASQSELLLYELADTRETVYLSTIRTGDAIVDTLDGRAVDTGTVEAIRLDTDEPVDHAQTVLADLGDGVNLVVDPVDVLEGAGDGQYRQLLADLKQRVTGTSSVVVLHCLTDGETPTRRRDTLHVADLVFDLATEIRGDSVTNRMAVPKFRTGQSIEDVIKLDLTSEVEVDTTRNIL